MSSPVLFTLSSFVQALRLACVVGEWSVCQQFPLANRGRVPALYLALILPDPPTWLDEMRLHSGSLTIKPSGVRILTATGLLRFTSPPSREH